MAYFGTLYLDQEKDLAVRLDMEDGVLSYTLRAENHRTDNLIANLARVSGMALERREGVPVIAGQIPCYIRGDGQRVYIFRVNGTKLANIYPDGRIEVNSMVPAIAKTLMSQTKDYKFSFRQTVLKSYVPEHLKLTTDLHTHGNANLSADILLALAVKHQLRYPLYYIKKLGLTLTAEQSALLAARRAAAERTLDLSGLTGKNRDRRVDDNTFLNFADLLLRSPDPDNIRKIRCSLSILRDSQAVFTNLEKLYLYRYVFTKGAPAQDRIRLPGDPKLPDPDITRYLRAMLADGKNPLYADFSLYEDTLLWIGREYQKRHIRYVEISDTTLVKPDGSAAQMLARLHRVLPLVKAETGVDIRFLAAIRRIPLTLVKNDIVSDGYLTDAMTALRVVSRDPYVVGSDFVGEEITDIGELEGVIREIVRSIASRDEHFTLRVHAGENDSLKGNMAKAVRLVEEALLPGQKFPQMRIGHGLYGAGLGTPRGRALLEKLRSHGIILEFQLTSNVRLNNLTDLRSHPLKNYLASGVPCVMGTDGYGLYGTDSIHEQLALANFLALSDGEFLRMKAAEDRYLASRQDAFREKWAAFPHTADVEGYYLEQFARARANTAPMAFAIHKKPTYPVLKALVRELPWDKYPLVVAGGSFCGAGDTPKVTPQDRALLDTLLQELDPEKVFFVVGHRLRGQEKYLVEHNPGFEIYAIVPSLMEEARLRRLAKAPLTGLRISTETQEMGIYKSFNYEIFERRSSVVFAFHGNSAAANLVQEARNGKGGAHIFITPTTAPLRAKAASLKGYVTPNPTPQQALQTVLTHQPNTGAPKF